MTLAFSSYLPQDRLHALAFGHQLSELATGAALFADVSGFTPLTEALAVALGARRGAEELTNQINRVYDALIAEVDRYRGSVIGFAGDAITCWFDDRDGPAAARATACAQALQQAMTAFIAIPLPAGSTTALAIKVAVASGPARRFVIGDPAVQLVDTLAGATVARMAAGEHLANPGEVLVDQATAAALSADATFGPWRAEPGSDDRFAPLLALAAPPPHTSWPPADDTLTAEQLRPWLLPAVYQRELAGQGTFLTELRPADVLFLRFMGMNYETDPDAAARLDDLVRAAQQVVTRYDGTLLQITIGDKGAYLYAAFGAPVAHEDDAHRAALAAVELHRIAAEQPGLAPFQIGMSQGTMRCGAYGGRTRRTYGVLGDEVNLAARLMQLAAPGETLISGRLHAALGNAFTYEPRPPIAIKGKSEPLPVFAIASQRQRRAVRLEEPVFALPLVGRAAELAAIDAAIDQALAGQGRILGVTAEAGLGKSRLISEGIRLARQRGLVGYGGSCQAVGTSTPYLVWQPIWRALFAVDPDAPRHRQVRALEGLVGEWAPDRLDALALLGSLLGVPVSETDFTQALEPKDRQGTLHALLRDCLAAAAREAAAEGGGLLLVLDDLHWIDAASEALLEDVAGEIPGQPVLLLLASRPPDPRLPAGLRAASLPGLTQIALAGLDRAASEQLIRAKLIQLFPARGGGVPPELVTRIEERAQGNPFYIEELLNYLRDRAIDPRDQAALAAIDLPESLHRLILSRLDVLSAQQQITIKTASVIGRRFLFSWLIGTFPLMLASGQLAEDLAALAQLDLTPLDTPEPELAYLFKHLATREVAYETLSAATRAGLHEQLALYLEELAGEEPGRFLDLLAYHYGQSEHLPKKREYLRRAGEAAAARYANESALDYLSRALALAPPEDEAERTTLLLAREQVVGLLGDRAAQRADLDALEVLSARAGDAGLRAEVALRRGRYFERTGAYPEALAAAREGVAHAQAAGRTDLEAAGYQRWGWALRRLGDTAGAREQLERSLTLAQASGNHRQVCLTLNDLGGLAADRGDFAQAHDDYSRSLELARASGNRQMESMTLGNLGSIASDRGDLAAARLYLEQSLALARAIGDRLTETLTLVNLSFLLAQLGNYADSRAAGEQSLALARAMDNRSLQGSALGNLGLAAVSQGDASAARGYYQASLEIAQALGDEVVAGWARRGLGSAALAEGDLASAEQHYQASLETLRAAGSPALVAEPLAGLARVALARGDAGAAMVPVEEILAHLAAGTLDGAEEPMLVYLSCVQALQAAGDPRAPGLLARAQAELQERAARIADPAARQMFLEQVPAHRALAAAWAVGGGLTLPPSIT